MDLRDWPEDELDGCIRAALRTNTVVSQRQKQRSWEQLRQKAAQQTILPLVTASRMTLQPVKHPSLLDILSRPCRSLWAWLGDLMVDDGQYARASRIRSGLTIHGIYQTYMIFRLPA